MIFFLRHLLNIPGPLDIPARLCKGNFDDEMFNHQVPYLWLIYWWDIIYCGEKCCILGLHLLFITELHCVKINLLLKSLKQNLRDAKVYTLLKKERSKEGFYCSNICNVYTLSFLYLIELSCRHTMFSFIFFKQPLSSSSIKY